MWYLVSKNTDLPRFTGAPWECFRNNGIRKIELDKPVTPNVFNIVLGSYNNGLGRCFH